MTTKTTIDQTTEAPEKAVEAPKTEAPTQGSESKAIAEPSPTEGTVMPRIKADMPLGSVKFDEYDGAGNKTGKVVTLNHLFKAWASHEDKGRSLSNTFASFALAVAESNPDLSADGQANIFRTLANKAATKAFPAVAAMDEYGYPMVNGDGQPILMPTIPDSYKTMLSGIVALWTGKAKTRGGREKVEHPPIIPGKVYPIWDGRKNAWEDRLVLTLGHMKAALRGMDKQVADKKELQALKFNRDEVAKTVALLEKEGFTDEEVKGTSDKAVKASTEEDASAKSVGLHLKSLENLLTERRRQKAEKAGEATSETEATPAEVKAGETVKPVTDEKTGETAPVDTETGMTPIEALDTAVERHIRPEETYKLQYLATLFASLEGKPRDDLMSGLNALINTCLKANPTLEKKVKAAVEARRKARAA